TNFQHLTRLGLSANQFGDQGVAELARSAAFPALRSLNLGSNDLTTAGVTALAQYADWPQLWQLELKGNGRLGAAAVRALLSSSRFSGLRSLDLEECGLGDRGVAEFAEATCRPRSLTLQKNNFGPEGAKLLAACPALAELRVLDVQENPIGADGFHAL